MVTPASAVDVNHAARIAIPSASVRSPWFHSAAFDGLLLLGVPFLTWPLVMAGQSAWGPELLLQLILLTATGHYFATFVRTYGDLELFQRFRTRFLVAPVVLSVTCFAAYADHAAALLLVTACWGFWHWLAQAFGFARIYDIKVGSIRPLTAWLDKALVISGFVGAVTLNPGAVAMFGKLFLDAGIPLPDAARFAVVQWIVFGGIAVVGSAYLANLSRSIVRREAWSWQKQLMHATTIGYYWFAFAWLPNVLVAYVLYELFHDIQYYAITYLTCRQRVRRPGVAAWLSWMFRPRFAGALVFVIAMTAFGALDLVGRREAPVLVPLFLSFALLHYYYDGFIWKARESALGSDLGIQSGLRNAAIPGLRHAASWALFFVPLLGVIVLGGRSFTPLERAEELVALAPDDFLSQGDLGFALATSGELERAIEHYRASIAAHPDISGVRANFGALLDYLGDLDGAREQYEHALRSVDQGRAHAQAHTNLGVLLLTRNELASAQEHLRAGRALGGENPLGRLFGLAAAIPAENLERRCALFGAILQLDPKNLDARFQYAQLLLARSRCELAEAQFAVVVQHAPGFVPGLVGLASAQAGLGRVDAARTSVQRALELEPGNAHARTLQAELGVR
ncbi:MAG: tetratricopeptide repeat protein [Planctomycetes bacterium]|nr:tetratricopeptide repeat protein [Planctomycetota bacterium]